MERLTRRELAELENGQTIVLCNYKEEECNDYCLYGCCKWNKKALEKLKEYEDAEEQGLLIRLPCKVGDTVYPLDRFCSGYIGDCEKRPCNECSDYELYVNEKRFELKDIYNFGKPVFMTREEAEAALERISGDDDQTK